MLNYTVRVTASLAVFFGCLILTSHPSIAQIEYSGKIGSQVRWFSANPDPGSEQGTLTGALEFESEFYFENDNGSAITVVPYVRYDSMDPRRSRIDLREANYLMFGSLGESDWDLRLGIGRVFWGATESRHLVDIVNQTDVAYHPNEETKLGQPMAHFTVTGNWGTLELLALPYHRKRTLPGKTGRLRPDVVDNKKAFYEHPDKERHLDFAARYSNTFGSLDMGISLFNGTSREPYLIPTGTNQVHVSPYRQIQQFGLDAQLAAGPLLFKFESIHRSGQLNVYGKKESYNSFVFGSEYSIYSFLGTKSDLTLFGEWIFDNRGHTATTFFDNDLFFAARFALNDIQDTEVITSILGDRDRKSRILTLEVNRRLADYWSLHMEANVFMGVDVNDPILYPIRKDSFIEVGLSYSF